MLGAVSEGQRKEPVETLVFFDLESTGLPAVMPRKKVNITEISLVAIGRTNFKAPFRYINKMTYCIRPRHAITLEASRLSGLDNEELEKSPSFDEVAPLVEHFLLSLPQPVCLIAHNGNSFDFPLLMSELGQFPGVILRSLVDCCDSLPAFREIFKRFDLEKVAEQRALHELGPEFWAAFEECDVTTDVMGHDEATPSKCRTVPINAFPHKKVVPPSRLQSTNNMTAEVHPHARRALFPEGKEEGSIESQSVTALERKPNGRQSFSLGHVYKRIFQRPMQSAHNAESDCMALAEICCYLKDPFLEYLDANRRPLRDVKPMW